MNIVNSNQGKVEIRKQLETYIEPASCEQFQTVFISCRQSFVPAPCERAVNVANFVMKFKVSDWSLNLNKPINSRVNVCYCYQR